MFTESLLQLMRTPGFELYAVFLQIIPRELAFMMFIRCDFLLHYCQANCRYPTFEITFFRAFQQTQFKSMLSLHNVNSHWCCTWWYNMSTYVRICLCPSLSLWQVSLPLTPKQIIRRDMWRCQVVSWASPTGGLRVPKRMKDSCQETESPQGAY